jgi:predicted extracellular nuclease
VRPTRSLLVAALVSLVLIALAGARLQPAGAASTDLFFSEYIEGSSNNKALEIFNGTGAPVDLGTGGYTVRMFFNGNPVSTLAITLTGTVAPGDVFVVAQATASPTILAQADQVNGAGWFNGDDAVALMKGPTGNDPVDVIGQIGLDPGTEWGTGLTSTADNTLRRKAAIVAGDTNGGDAFDPAVEWDGFAIDTFDGLGSHGGNAAVTANCGGPLSVEQGSPASRNVSATDPDGRVTSLAIGSITPAPAAGSITLNDVVPAAAAGGTATGRIDVDGAVPAGSYDVVLTASNDDAAPQSATCTLNVAVAQTYEIHELQGASHNSPLVGQPVSGVTGIVTAKRSNGYYLQDPTPDADDATSDAIFVFTSAAPAVNVGDAVKVGGIVSEFRPGGTTTANLTTTEIVSPTTAVLSTGNPLPGPTVIGLGGRTPPDAVIDDDSFAAFDPAEDGIDFYESLEANRIQVNNPVVVGPQNDFGEIYVLADDGAGAAVRTARGGIVIRPGDFNPERIQFDDAVLLGSTPDANVGDHFTTPAVGVLDYDFGNFEVELTSPLTTVPDGVTPETTAAAGPQELSVATFNVENLGGNELQTKYDALAGEIVNALKSPDILSLEEIQDNNGATNDTVVDADVTLGRLRDAIVAAGGPTYAWRQINPVDDQDGGQPGGNIRVGFFFRGDRGVAFVDSPGGDSTTATGVVTGADGKPHLTFSPGRVDPGSSAWSASRKPLAGEFTYRGRTFFLITNHFNSKGGDDPLFGRFQPPVRVTEVQRHQQAQLVDGFVDSILAADDEANVVVLGDLNDFEFSETMGLLTDGGTLHPLMSTLPQEERYSYVFEGNSQSLDHIVVSDKLFDMPFTFDPVHVNAEFANQLSDHDPQVARFLVNAAPEVDAGGPYSVAEGASITLSATGSDPEGDSLSYSWDLDNDGDFETPGQTVTYMAGDGPATPVVQVEASDGSTAGTAAVTISISNVAPTASFVAPATSFAGFPFTLSLPGATDPSAADVTAGFQYAFDCGDGAGYGPVGSSSSRSCPTSNVGIRTVRGQVRDKDGGVSEYTATVGVVVTFDSLCALTKAYSSKPAVATALCALLNAAEHAKTRIVREAALLAYRVAVVVSTGSQPSKAFTNDEGDTLIRLSRLL